MQRPTWRGGGGEGWEEWQEAHKELKKLHGERERIEREIAALEKRRERRQQATMTTDKEGGGDPPRTKDVVGPSSRRPECVDRTLKTRESWKECVNASENEKRRLHASDEERKSVMCNMAPAKEQAVRDVRREIKTISRKLEQKQKEETRLAQASESSNLLPEVTELSVFLHKNDGVPNPKMWLEVQSSDLPRLAWTGWLSSCFISRARREALKELKSDANGEADRPDLTFYSMHGELLVGFKFCSRLLLDDPFHVSERLFAFSILSASPGCGQLGPAFPASQKVSHAAPTAVGTALSFQIHRRSDPLGGARGLAGCKKEPWSSVKAR
eukprot:99919-Hanusia_phi.AAC.3